MPPLYQAVTPDTSALRDKTRGQAQDAWSNASQFFQSAAAGQTDGYAQGMSAWNNYGQNAAAMVPPGTAAGGTFTGPQSEGQNAYNNRLRELGVPEHVIEGNAWNVKDESNWNFGAVGDNGAAFGANQWNGPRKNDLFASAKNSGRDPSDPIAQADFWHQEMSGPYKKYYDQAVNSGTASGAADVILRGYERPADVHLIRRSADYLSR